MVSYCAELEVPGSICDQLQRHYLKRFENEHINSDEFINTCNSNIGTGGNDTCGVEGNNENFHDYGCKRSGIKVAIVHLATAKGINVPN